MSADLVCNQGYHTQFGRVNTALHVNQRAKELGHLRQCLNSGVPPISPDINIGDFIFMFFGNRDPTLPSTKSNSFCIKHAQSSVNASNFVRFIKKDSPDTVRKYFLSIDNWRRRVSQGGNVRRAFDTSPMKHFFSKNKENPKKSLTYLDFQLHAGLSLGGNQSPNWNPQPGPW